MQPHHRVLLLASALFLVLTSSFLPIFFTNAAARLAAAFAWLELKHGYHSPPKYPKYFQEAQESGVLRHYDGRFQHGILTDANRMDTQIHMMRAYLEFSKEQGLETWLAHGTLLGWWWNAKILPWDNDIDVQLSLPTLNHLAAHHNHTIYEYSSSLIPEINPPPSVPTPLIQRTYLLDINPAFQSRTRDNGNNVIDARWIDTRNGLYIDLTAVSETQPALNPGIWSCKNEHRYQTQDLYPMRETLFEGVVAKVPYAYVKVLSAEYQEKALVLTEYEGHWWNHTSRLWVKKTAEERKQDRLEREDSRRRKLAEKAGLKAAKVAAKAQPKAKATGKEGGAAVPDQHLGDENEVGSIEASKYQENASILEKEPLRRRRRAVVTEALVAELVAEEELTSSAKRRRERQDVL